MRFCRFLAAEQILRVDVLQPDEHPPHAGLGRLLDEVRNAVAQRVHLDGEADVHAFLAQRDHPVEQRFPVAVAGEIVVGDEEALDALRDVLADDLLQIVGRAEAALAALHVDDGAERALIGAAAAEIDAGQRAGRAAHMLARQDRRRLALERRQVVHVVVERRQLAGPGVAQHRVEPAFLGLAGEERDAERLRLAHLRRHLRQHREAAGDVEAADGDRQPGGEERPRQVDRARELVGLHADQRDQRPAAGACGSSRMMRSGRTRRLVSS